MKSSQFISRVKELVAESQRLLGKEHFDSDTIAERQVLNPLTTNDAFWHHGLPTSSISLKEFI